MIKIPTDKKQLSEWVRVHSKNEPWSDEERQLREAYPFCTALKLLEKLTLEGENKSR